MNLIFTVCSADWYQYHIPMFVFTAARAYPECDVKVLVHGVLNDDVKNALSIIDAKNFEVIENQYQSFPHSKYICNILRLFIPKSYLLKYDYVYVTDVDFLLFRQKPSHFQYYAAMMKTSGQPYGAFRSAITRPYRSEISAGGWRGNFTRIVAGTLMLNSSDWFKKAFPVVREYRNLFKKNKHDNYDPFLPGSYREQDEVTLYRICKKSGLKIPGRKGTFVGGKRFNVAFRDIHLGDFRKAKSRRKLSWLITKQNVRRFKKLDTDTTWLKICNICCRNDEIRQCIRRLRKYV